MIPQKKEKIFVLYELLSFNLYPTFLRGKRTPRQICSGKNRKYYIYKSKEIQACAEPKNLLFVCLLDRYKQEVLHWCGEKSLLVFQSAITQPFIAFIGFFRFRSMPRGALAHRAACLRWSDRWSAIMAMNSLLVGLPLMPETV